MGPKLPSILKPLEERLGLPPLSNLTEILSSDNGKRINSILDKLLRLSTNQDALREANELLRLVQEMGRSGDLQHLDSILKSLPKGKTGQALIAEVRILIDELDKKLDKVSNLAQSILTKED